MSSLDPVIHPPARLQLCALLRTADEVEFHVAREVLGVSDSVLSKHVGALADAGYAESRKAVESGRRTTWLRLTRAGRRAFSGHVRALQAMIDAADAGLQRTEASSEPAAQRAPDQAESFGAAPRRL